MWRDVTTPERALTHADTVLVIDWPSRDVPETLARAGYRVLVKGGPGPDDYSAWVLRDGQVVTEQAGRPDHADLVYTHRPIAELPGIVAMARELGAATMWLQSGLSATGAPDPNGTWLGDDDAQQARAVVEAAGIGFISDHYIADLVREVRSPAPPNWKDPR